MDQFQLFVALACGLVTLIAVFVIWKKRASEKPMDTKYETTSTLIGILVDVSKSMRNSASGKVEEKGGKWAKSIFKVVDELIKHDVLSSNQTFALAFGSPSDPTISDLLSTVRKANEEISRERAQIEDIKRSRADKRDLLDDVLVFLERNKAPRVRHWGKMDVLLKVVDDTDAAAMLHYLQKSLDFTKKFVHECLPIECRELRLENVPTEIAYGVSGYVPFIGSSVQSWATEESVNEAVEKGKRLMAKTRQEKAAEFQLVDVSKGAIMSVHVASEILHDSVGDQELTNERVDELMETIEPCIYGRTPLMQAIHHSVKLFTYPEFANHQKLLFILSDGMPTDGNDPPLQTLSNLGVTVVSCFITNQKLSDPRHLYSIQDENWTDPAKFMFGMSSIITTQKIPHTLFVKRGWKIDFDNNETRLFFQVNHPDLIKEVCDMAKKGVLSQDALSDMLSTVDLDLYINTSNDGFRAKKQDESTCYANASAAVLHLAMKRVIGRDGGYPDFYELRRELIAKYGKHGAPTKRVLEEVCPKYRLQCKEVDAIGAMKAISAKQPVVARFYLSGAQWDQFHQFYEDDPKGILTRSYLDSKHHSTTKPCGHAVVLTSYDAESLRLMNSWGDDWADNGFFRVQNANVLPCLKFFDVFWTEDSLSQKEKRAYDQHGAKTADKLMRSLKGIQEAKYKCPLCKVESKVVDYSGHLLRTKCPSCREIFNANKAGGDLALNLYLTSLMH